jgi:hypothetical protein
MHILKKAFLLNKPQQRHDCDYLEVSPTRLRLKQRIDGNYNNTESAKQPPPKRRPGFSVRELGTVLDDRTAPAVTTSRKDAKLSRLARLIEAQR